MHCYRSQGAQDRRDGGRERANCAPDTLQFQQGTQNVGEWVL